MRRSNEDITYGSVSDVSYRPKAVSEFDPPPLFMEDAKYCIYVIQSKKDKSIYFGYTNDLKRRFEEHNKGLCPSTKDKIPHRMAFYEGYSSGKDARTR